MEKIENNTLHHGDCLVILPRIEKKSVNMVLVDLPYGEIDCTWDNKIDLNSMWKELKRVGTDNCIYVFFCSTRFGVDLINSNPKWFCYDIVWKKTNAVGFLNARVLPLRAHEMIYIFKKKNKPKGCKSVYNPQKTKGEPYNRVFTEGNNSFVKKNHAENQVYRHRETDKRSDNLNDGWRYPTSVIEFKKDRLAGHSTEKPLGLCEWLVKTYSNEGDTVLDFCMGSGTTCVASVNTGRKYIGIELDEKWYNISVERVANVAPATPVMVDEIPLEVIDDTTDVSE